FGELGDRLVQALGIDDQHEWLTVDRGRDLKRLGGIDWRLLEQMLIRRDRGRGMNEDGVAVGFRPSDIFHGDVAAGAGLVFHDHRAVWAQLFGKMPNQNIRAAAGRKGTDETDVLVRIGLGLGAGRHRALGYGRRHRESRATRQPFRLGFHLFPPVQEITGRVDRSPWPPVPVGQRQRGRVHSWNASSRVLRNCGSTIRATTATVAARRTADIGRSKNTIGSPREMTKDRLRFSSMSGPRMNPKTSGAGSHPNLSRMYPNTANTAHSTS